MKTSDLPVLDPVERITLPTSPTPGRMESLGRKMKRGRRRILGQFGGEGSGGQAYHVMSRTAGGEMLFGEVEKEAVERKRGRLLRWQPEPLVKQFMFNTGGVPFATLDRKRKIENTNLQMMRIYKYPNSRIRRFESFVYS